MAVAKSRLQIDVNDETLEKLREFKEKNGGSFGDITERALKTFLFLHNASVNENCSVKVVSWDGTEKEIYFL